MIKLIKVKFSRPALLLIFFALFFCLSGCGGSIDTGTSTGTGTGTGTSTTTDQSSLSLSVLHSVTYGTPITVTAILRDANGALVPNAVVYFAASNELVTFTPTSATALTNVNGTASVTLNAASNSSAGATLIAAAAQVTTAGTTTNIQSAWVGIAVYSKPNLSSLILNVSSNVVTFGTPITATATLTDADGFLLQNAIVTFTAGNSLVAFTPTSSTVLTNASGVASIILNSASIGSTGATTITASAQLDTTTTITSKPVAIAVNGATVTINSLTVSQQNISSYGTTSVIAKVTPASIPVTFTSACVVNGKATLSSPVTADATGTATSTYKDNNCNAGTDTITASVTGGAQLPVTITVTPPAATNIQFVSATPSVIGTSTTGATTLSKSSVVKFQVVDSSNNGVGNVVVDFTTLPVTPPGNAKLSALSATSDATGYVTTALTAGTVPTPVWVVATIHNTSYVSQSNMLTITTGLPTQDFFSLAISTHNIEGWNYNGTSTALTIIASDRLGETVPDGTAINFISEGGHLNSSAIAPSTSTCQTQQGTCAVTFTSADYRPIGETINYGGATGVQGAVPCLEYDGVTPITINGGAPLYVQNGRVTVLAYALGEMSFVDSDGSNMYKSPDTFYELGQLFLDSNENGILDKSNAQPNLQEQTIGNAPGALACGTETYSGVTYVWSKYPDNYANVPSVQNSCVGPTITGGWGQTYVRRDDVIVLSGSFAQISQDTFASTGKCYGAYVFWLMDENYNPMPADTTVSINVAYTNVNFTYTDTTKVPPQVVGEAAAVAVAGSPVLDTTHAGGTPVAVIISGGKNCDAAAVPGGTIKTYPKGPVAIDVTTRKGNKTTIGLTIN